MTLELCVLLWAAENLDDALTEYEDTVLALVPKHGGRVVSRVRRISDGDGPREVQVIHLPDDAALQAYMSDPERVALADVHRRVVARTEILTVDTIV
ncbi:DUF1330 domain-containing protein [Microbacterium terricola]|uniref:DUF1330 domain-containing protein n=1 Tax=Microbacterium terricola TaxID=344163 RepID=A0ABM8DW00_9MICO|nr:DUF1330 domain-containing protein [Microbacterium terricola]UYK39430.1 DUF1330 domain-containing protein [Microbacterium terricola]BDV29843.1 hypothetical protein Microterr_05030 [Microbacterium terricola]